MLLIILRFQNLSYLYPTYLIGMVGFKNKQDD